MSKKNKNGNEGIRNDYNDRLNDLIKDLAPIKGKKPKLVYEYEVLDGSDNDIDNIRNSFSKNSFVATEYKKETHSNNGKVNIAEQFINGDYSSAVANISQGIDYKSPHLKIEEVVVIQNKLNAMIQNPTKEKMMDDCTYIIDISEMSTKNTNPPSIERKKYLESIKQLFTAIKEGFEKGFDKVKNGINFAFEKVKSLGKDKITVITDRNSKQNTR